MIVWKVFFYFFSDEHIFSHLVIALSFCQESEGQTTYTTHFFQGMSEMDRKISGWDVLSMGVDSQQSYKLCERLSAKIQILLNLTRKLRLSVVTEPRVMTVKYNNRRSFLLSGQTLKTVTLSLLLVDFSSTFFSHGNIEKAGSLTFRKLLRQRYFNESHFVLVHFFFFAKSNNSFDIL